MRLGTGYRSSWVLANGVRTHYWESGDEGPPVVLIHGGGAGISGEIGYHHMLEGLAPWFRLYAPDQISYGYTDRRPHAWPVLGQQSLVDHVADFIDALCLDEVILAGNSQGAYVAAKYAIEHPERVRKLFLIASGTIYQAMGGQGQRAEREAHEYDGTEEAMRRHLKFTTYDMSRVTDELVKARHDIAGLPGSEEAKRAFDEGNARRRSDPNLQLRFSMRDTLPHLQTPAMFVWGNEDRFAPVEWGHELKGMLPSIPFHFIDRSGHQCQNDRPDLVNELAGDFFRSG